jgi:hypothetical protein
MAAGPALGMLGMRATNTLTSCRTVDHRPADGRRPHLLALAVILAALAPAACRPASGGRPPAESGVIVAEAVEVPTGSPSESVPADAAATPDAGQAEPSGATGGLRRLTEPGCCTQPFWSVDGRRVMFIDRPAPEAPTGIWSVDVDRPSESPELVTEAIGYYTPDMALRVDVSGGATTIVRVASGERWTVPAEGEPVVISPGGARITWQISSGSVSTPRRTAGIWVADLSGDGARAIATLPRGSLSGWISDDALLVRGRDALDAADDVLWVLDVRDGARREVVRARGVRGELTSPGGGWVAYYLTRQDDLAANGIWIAPLAGGEARRLTSDLFGAYRWRDAAHLLVVPMRVGASTHEVIEVDAATLETATLTDHGAAPFKIANGDWTVSPGGERIAFVESRDKSIWMLDLPTRAR